MFNGPNHPYTEALLSAIPSVDGGPIAHPPPGEISPANRHRVCFLVAAVIPGVCGSPAAHWRSAGPRCDVTSPSRASRLEKALTSQLASRQKAVEEVAARREPATRLVEQRSSECRGVREQPRSVRSKSSMGSGFCGSSPPNQTSLDG